MAIYFESLQQFKENGGLKASTITAKQLLPAVVAHMQRMDRKFTLHVNGRLPKSMDALLEEVFALCHLQQPFYTQHCASRHSRYMNVSKKRVKIEFTLKYRMTREEEKWTVDEIQRILATIVTENMTTVEKIIAVHDYIIRAYDYEMQTEGSPFTVYTFMHERQGVCMAYALLFEKMMELLDIPCYYVVGKADGESDLGHAWNMVQLDGEWYHIDATWNDLGKRTKGHEIRYRYFLRSDDFMKRDHQWNFDHYPMCKSERFEALSNLYDVAFVDGQLYFPHPKTGFLMKMDPHILSFQSLLDTRVQNCTVFDGELYVSNYDDHGFLYRYNWTTQQLELLDKRFVERIWCNESTCIVTFNEGEPFILERLQEQHKTDTLQQLIADIEVPLLSFGDSWFASYEGERKCVAFQSEDGVRLIVPQPIEQLTLDIQCHKGLDIKMTSKRKDVVLQEAATLIMPKSLLPPIKNIRVQPGQAVNYIEENDSLHLKIERNTKILFS